MMLVLFAFPPPCTSIHFPLFRFTNSKLLLGPRPRHRWFAPPFQLNCCTLPPLPRLPPATSSTRPLFTFWITYSFLPTVINTHFWFAPPLQPYCCTFAPGLRLSPYTSTHLREPTFK